MVAATPSARKTAGRGSWPSTSPAASESFQGRSKQSLCLTSSSARKHSPHGVVFVTNQELRLSERAELESRGGDIEVDIFHLERVAHVLDKPRMAFESVNST